MQQLFAGSAREAELTRMAERRHQEACGGLDFEVALEALAPMIRNKITDAKDPMVRLQTLDWGELVLAAGCANGERVALDIIDRELLAGIRGALRSMKLNDTTVDETLQQVREKLLVAKSDAEPLICKYAGEGSLRSLVRVVAVRTALMRLRKEKREVLDGGGESSRLERALGDDDPELSAIREQYKDELKAAFERAVATLSARQRNVMRLQMVDGVAVDEIARLYDVHRVSVSRWLGDARRHIAATVKADLGSRLGLAQAELQSLIRLVQSQVELSVERVLRSQG